MQTKLYKHILLLIISFISLNVSAQSNKTYFKGHYINLAQEVVPCSILNERYTIHNQLNILVNGIEKTIYPKDCLEAKIEKSTLKSISISNDNTSKAHFYFVGAKGQFNLYYRNLLPKEDETETFNFSLDNHVAFVLEKNSKRIEIERIGKKSFENFVRNFPEDKILIDRLMDVHFSVERWTKTIEEYNNGQRAWKESY